MLISKSSSHPTDLSNHFFLLAYFFTAYPQEPDFTQAFYKALSNNPLGMAQIALAIAIIEGHYYAGDFWAGGGDRKAGELGFDPLGFSKVSKTVMHGKGVFRSIPFPSQSYWVRYWPSSLSFFALLLLQGKSDAAKKSLQLKEIKNGRLAMVACAAFASEHFIPGSVPLVKAAFPAVPL